MSISQRSRSPGEYAIASSYRVGEEARRTARPNCLEIVDDGPELWHECTSFSSVRISYGSRNSCSYAIALSSRIGEEVRRTTRPKREAKRLTVM